MAQKEQSVHGKCSECYEKFTGTTVADVLYQFQKHNIAKHPCGICATYNEKEKPTSRDQMVHAVHLNTQHPPEVVPTCSVCHITNYNGTDMCPVCTENSKHPEITKNCSGCGVEISHEIDMCPPCLMDEEMDEDDNLDEDAMDNYNGNDSDDDDDDDDTNAPDDDGADVIGVNSDVVGADDDGVVGADDDGADVADAYEWGSFCEKKNKVVNWKNPGF
jgi:hypothetical protein